MPEISVIIPAYNQGHYLSEALESVLAQDYPNFEVIVVDDGSSDHTAQVVQRFSDRRIHYIFQENRGLPAARNTGIRAAQGKYLSFLDSDDRFLPKKLSLLKAEFASQPEIGLAAGQAKLIDQDGNLLGSSFQSQQVNEAHCLLLGNPFHVGSVLLRRSWQEKVGFFDENLRSYEDWDFWLRLGLSGCTFQVIDQPVSLYRFHTDQMTRNGAQMTQASFQVLDKVFSSPHLPPQWEELQGKAYASAYLRAAAQAFLATDYLLAQQYLTLAVQRNPELADNAFTPLAARFAGWTDLPKMRDPLAFLENIYDHLPPNWVTLKRLKSRELGQTAIALAFQAYANREYRVARRRILQALSYRPGCIVNRGVLSIFLKSVVRISSKPAETLVDQRQS
jgi:glycosyltransferase involved in cell wall biosynthesis